MKPDYKRFTQNREIFPRTEENSSRLICGHLNRLKFPTDIQNYLKNRAQKKSMVCSLAKANRCFCRHQEVIKDEAKQRLYKIESTFEESKNLVRALQNIEIVLPKDKNT